jgi:hypothetical protein
MSKCRLGTSGWAKGDAAALGEEVTTFGVPEGVEDRTST